MITISETSLHSVALHYVGNKSNSEGNRIAKSLLRCNDNLTQILLSYFLGPFKSGEYFHLSHEDGFESNTVFQIADEIFANPETLYKQSVLLAQHLYEQQDHPKIKPGEFFACYFENLVVDGEEVNAIGLFKSENKDTFMKIYPMGEDFGIETEDGINIHKLEKACLIYNTERENGYLLSVIDNGGKSLESRFWSDNFLQIAQRKDNYFKTQNVIQLCKNFVEEKLPAEFEVSKADQADILNKSVNFFKKKEKFDLKEFADEVIQQPEMVKSFKDYKKDYEKEWETEIPQSFDLSTDAVKKETKSMRSVIKLDKNFHIYVHGNSNYIMKGFDKQTGMHFYQLYFNEES